MPKKKKPALAVVPTEILEQMCDIISLVNDMNVHQRIATSFADIAEEDEEINYEELASVAMDWLPLIEANIKQLVGQLEEISEGAPELVELLESLTDEGDEDDDFILE